MNFIDMLVALPVLGLLYVAYTDWKLTRECYQGNRNGFTNTTGLGAANGARRAGSRPSMPKLQRITGRDLPRILETIGNVVLIDLRDQYRRNVLPIPEALVLRVSPEELKDLTPWMPVGTCILICGDWELCQFALAEVPETFGAAIYVLSDRRSR